MQFIVLVILGSWASITLTPFVHLFYVCFTMLAWVGWIHVIESMLSQLNTLLVTNFIRFSSKWCFLFFCVCKYFFCLWNQKARMQFVDNQWNCDCVEVNTVFQIYLKEYVILYECMFMCVCDLRTWICVYEWFVCMCCACMCCACMCVYVLSMLCVHVTSCMFSENLCLIMKLYELICVN